MGVEIERKFLVIGDSWREHVTASIVIRQGYLVADDVRTVRVRVADGRGYLTIKGRPSDGTIGRAEHEYEIPAADALTMLETLCQPGVIEKTRHIIPISDTIAWEIDEFGGAHAGLVIAEIELAHESQPYPRPPWLGNEVTHDRRYANSALAAALD
jgi:adenylate cyclase